ncbi:MAG: M16 family metallopeptidase [Armatimonadota bacterium]
MNMRWWCLGLAMLVAAGTGSAVQETDEGAIKASLPNGLKILLKEVHNAPVVAFQVWYEIGSADEPAGLRGVAHMLEHMLFKGTQNYPGGEIPRLLKKNGARSNAFTSFDYTCFFETLASDRLELAVRIEADRMARGLIRAEDRRAEMTVVRSELEGGENNPGEVLWDEMLAAAYKAHPYQVPIIGWRADIERMRADEVRAYYQQHYRPNNALVVVVGDIDPQATLALLREHFGPIAPGPVRRHSRTPEPEQLGPRRVLVRKEGTTNYVNIAFHGPELKARDTYAMDVLDGIMSSGRTSRMYQNLVETQLATSAGSGSWTPKDAGLFNLSATVREGVEVTDVVKALWEEVRRAKSTLPSEEELQRVKTQVAAAYVFQKDSVTSQAFTYGSHEALHSWRYPTTYVEEISKVTAEDVQRVARKYLNRDNSTTAIFEPITPAAAEARLPSPTRLASHPRGVEPRHYAERPGEIPAPVVGRGLSTTVFLGGPLGAALPRASERSEPVRTVLDNGLVLLVQENHNNTTIAVQGHVLAGGLYDPNDRPGLAAMVGSLLNRGTKTRTSLELAAATESVGAYVGIGQSYRPSTMAFGGKCLTQDLDIVLDVLSDMLRNPSFPQEEIDKLRNLRLSGLRQSLESTQARAQRAFLRLVFPPHHPYGAPTVEEQEKSYQDMTREDITGFHKAMYGPDVANMVIVGDITPDEALAKAKQYFGDWEPVGRSREVTVPDVEPREGIARRVIPMMDKSEVTVLLGHYGGLKRTDPDFYKAQVMNFILGGGSLTSRLGLKLRDELGLVYGVWSYFRTYKGRGDWRAQFGTNPDNADRAIEALLAEIRRMRDHGATAQELEDAVDYLTGSYPVGLETNSDLADELLRIEFYDLGLDYISRHSDIYRAITLEDVNEAARKYLHPDRYALVIAGPYEERD